MEQTSKPSHAPQDSSSHETIREQLDRLFEEMVTHQRKKLLAIAREHYPAIGSDDLLNPHDFGKLEADARFQFEDGMLAGYIAAQMAVRAELVCEKAAGKH
jgi:hypothetical protein